MFKRSANGDKYYVGVKGIEQVRSDGTQSLKIVRVSSTNQDKFVACTKVISFQQVNE